MSSSTTPLVYGGAGAFFSTRLGSNRRCQWSQMRSFAWGYAMLMRMKHLSMATTTSLIPLVPCALPRYSSHLRLKWKVLYLIGYTFITLFPKKSKRSKGRNPWNFLRYAIGRIHTHALTKFKIPTCTRACISPVKINTYLFSFQKGNLLIYIVTHIGGIDAIHIFLFITSENNQLPPPLKSQMIVSIAEKM